MAYEYRCFAVPSWCIVLVTFVLLPQSPAFALISTNSCHSKAPHQSWNLRTETTDGTTTIEMSSTFSSFVSQNAQETFRGKNILLTGASGGLGGQLALQLASCGVQTLVLSARKVQSLESIAEKCQETLSSKTITTHCVPCDLSNKESVIKLGQEALKLCNNHIDILINCGGVSSRSNFIDTALEIDEAVMQINFLSGASLCHALIPPMIESGGGKVIWISSVQGLVGIPSRTSYAASKFAVQGYCEALRAELTTSNVTVHCVSPGYIRTNLSKSALTGDGTTHGKMDATTENGADPQDVAIEILELVARGRTDFVVAATTSAKAAIWLRLLCPVFLQSMLVKRFVKSQQHKEKEE
jgi:dehydrogenase/reductase SDR family member 7B